MGRPRKYGDAGLTADLRIPVTPEQKQLIADAVQLLGMDLAAWARPILIRAAEAELTRARKARGNKDLGEDG